VRLRRSRRQRGGDLGPARPLESNPAAGVTHGPRLCPSSPLGVAPEHQGEGLGSRLLAPILEICDSDGIPAYLESSKHSNIAFYTRHGFRVSGELRMPGGGPLLYPMWREPIGGSSSASLAPSS
jgi:GNAT superfamily N-acetyltransferase